MAKKKTIRKKPPKLVRPRPEPVATNEPDATLNGTFDQDSFLGTAQDWMGPDATNATYAEEDETEQPYAAGAWPLLDKFLHGRVILNPKSVFLLLTIAWFGFISWLFKTDNELGRFDVTGGMLWFWGKAGIYTIFYVVVTVIVGMYSIYMKRFES